MAENKLEIELGLKELSPVERAYDNPTASNLKAVSAINQTSELVKYVVSHDAMALKQVSRKLINTELCKKAVSQNGLALQHVPKKYKSEEICNIAICNNGRAIEFVPQSMITEKMAKNAVGHYLGELSVEGEKLHYWEKYPVACIPAALLTEQILIESVKYSPHSLRDIPRELINRTVILAAVSVDGTALQYVPKNLMGKGVIAAAIANNPLSLEYISEKKITSELCNTCFERNIMSIKFFPRAFLTQELCDQAVNSNIIIFKCIPDDFKTVEMCLKVINSRQFSVNDMNRHEKEKYFGDENIEIITFIDIPENHRNNRVVIDNIVKLYKYGSVPILKWNNEMIERQIGEEKPWSFYNEKANPLFKETVEYLETKIIKQTYSLTEKHSEFIRKVNSIRTSDPKDGETEIEPISEDALPISYENDKPLVHVLTEEENGINTIHYITDIHLEHQFIKYLEKCGEDSNLSIQERLNGDEEFHNFYYETIDKYEAGITDAEIIGLFYQKKLFHFMDTKIEELVSGADIRTMLLVGGDVADDFELAEIFYKKLSVAWKGRIIFILGNHELWDGNSDPATKPLVIRSVDDIVNGYRQITKAENQVYGIMSNTSFLENDVYIKYKNKQECIISEKQVLNSDESELEEILSNSSLIILGGIGFSGLNPYYNASFGLYRHTITFEQDKAYSLRFCRVYDKLTKCVANRKVIVLTHTPIYDWSNQNYNPNWVYINGHTHQNNLIRKNDGTTVLSDNQIGYELKKWHLNSFSMLGWYNPLENYKDGIYNISSELYKEFNEGRGIMSNGCNYEGKIYALKRDGLYMFILETWKGLCLLVGGQRKKLEHNDVNYYYNNMSLFGQRVKDAIRPYQQTLEAISKEVKSFGGTGIIHGCIVDISYFSHIYVNPFDGKVTPYWALNTSSRLPFNNILDLLEQKESALVNKFELEQKKGGLLITGNQDLCITKKSSPAIIPKWVFGTEIYKPSRIMKSVQYVWEQNVIRMWSDSILNRENLTIE